MKKLVTLEKEDPTIFVTVPISQDDCVGDSLPFINFNFQSVDAALSNLLLSGENYWTPAYEYIELNKNRWDTALDYIEYLKSIAEEDVIAAETLSTKWFNPISLVYPTLSTSISLTLVTDWLNSNFVVTNNVSLDPSCYDYIQGQQAYVTVLQTNSSSAVVSAIGIEYMVQGSEWQFQQYL